MAEPFVWGAGGQKITTPEQAKRQREIAAALIKRSPSENWAQGLGSVTAALASNAIGGRASQAEEEGMARAGGLFSDLAINADPNSIIAALTSPDAAWATPAQTSIASALLNSGLERADPMYQAQLAKLQAEAAGGFAGSAPSSVQEWQYYNSLLPEDQSRYLNMKRSNTPLNIGTGFVTQDQANPGTIIGAPITINNEQKAFDTNTGAGLGTANAENIVAAGSVASKMPQLIDTVNTLNSLADTATYTQSGQAMDAVKRELGLPVGQGAIDRASYIAIVDNQVLPLLRDTFGAAFTEREGQTLRATLGDPNKSPPEKKAILDAFINQKQRDVEAMQSLIPGATAPATGGYTILGVE